jgi:4-hydroxybenzoate polyprenyltransferase
MSFGPLDVLRLYRLHTGLVTAAVPGLIVYILGGGPLLIMGVVLGAISHHAWGFSLNEIADLEVDKGNPELSHKPLVSGRMSKRAAGFLSFSALFISFLLFFISTIIEGCCPVIPMIILLAATISGTIYDLYGKKFPLSDIFVAMWYGLLIMAAASTVERWGPYSVEVWAAASLGFLHILFNNSVEGGLKDVENDHSSGARTLAVSTGCRADEGILRISRSFLIWGFLLRAVFIISASVFVLFISEEAEWGRWITVAVPVMGLFLFVHSLTFLQREVVWNRKKLIKNFALHEIFSFALSLVVILPAAGVVPALIALIAPVLWVVLFNRLIFRSGVAPKV